MRNRIKKLNRKKAENTKPKKEKSIMSNARKPASFRVKGKTEGQDNYIDAIDNSLITFSIGMAGTGKSYIALGLAVEMIEDGEVDSIIVARPTVETSHKGLGHLPGDIDEKLSPYVLPAVEHLKYFLGKDRYGSLYHEGKIKFEALEYMRGRTFNKSFIILEEAQNCTFEQLVMFVTRIGANSKMVINGDIAQNDLRTGHEKPYLAQMIDKIKRTGLENEGFAVIELTEADVIRNPIIPKFLKAME
jgi:phosphate starvation-inducible PhoH-like protein